MAKAQPLYTLDEQLDKLDTSLPARFTALNTVRYRLLLACSEDGNLTRAKNRFLNLIQDTEVRTLFSSLLEIPEIRTTFGIRPIQSIHNRFSSQYKLFPKVLDELSILKIPGYTVSLLDNYFSANEDPVYKLSVMASCVMMGYIQDDAINSRKE